MPAEWEPQGAVLMAWPRSDGDWQPYLPAVLPEYAALVRAIAAVVPVILLCDEPAGCPVAGATGVRVVQQPTNDTWTRDYGPLALVEDGRWLLLDCTFTGWGLKYPADQDNQATRRLHGRGFFGATSIEIPGLAWEGGGLESDGAGTILTTSTCLLSPNRNPHLDRAATEAALARHLGATRVLWLEHGHLEGDDTDAHIDTVARLCPGETIAYLRCDDPADQHIQDFAAMEAELQAFRTVDGRPYRLVPLPWAAARYAPDDGRRLPATYANALILNGHVFVPTYDDPARDAAGLAAWGEACPGYTIVAVPCASLLLQHGSLHCATMQLPVQVLSAGVLVP
jgi:agmatine deiminase